MRATLSVLLVAFPLLLAACAGSVTVDGEVDAFGPGTSGAYVELDLDGDVFHFFLLANQGGLCGKIQRGYELAAEATADFDDASDNDQCNAYLAGLEAAWDPLVRGEAHFAYTHVTGGNILGGYDEWTEPSTGNWDLTEESIFHLVYFPQTSPYEEAVDRGDGCDFNDVVDDGQRAIETLLANDGTLELEEGDNDAWRIDFEADMDDEDGDFVGEVAGGFNAPLCEVDANTLGGLEMALNPWAWLPWAL
jgi:hypothetical protein